MKTTIMEKMEGILEETNKLKALLDEKCEFCRFDEPCKMHYVEYTKANAVEVRELEPNEPF